MGCTRRPVCTRTTAYVKNMVDEARIYFFFEKERESARGGGRGQAEREVEGIFFFFNFKILCI